MGATDWLLSTRKHASSRSDISGLAPAPRRRLWPRPSVPTKSRAIVSRGGRPDLAGPLLPQVRAPTLLIVGGNDVQVIELNRAAFAQLRCEKQLVIVPGATHLFEEPGALDEVARLAREWFERHLAREEVAPAPT